jgi:hypothetical protein
VRKRERGKESRLGLLVFSLSLYISISLYLSLSLSLSVSFLSYKRRLRAHCEQRARSLSNRVTEQSTSNTRAVNKKKKSKEKETRREQRRRQRGSRPCHPTLSLSLSFLPRNAATFAMISGGRSMRRDLFCRGRMRTVTERRSILLGNLKGRVGLYPGSLSLSHYLSISTPCLSPSIYSLSLGLP